MLLFSLVAVREEKRREKSGTEYQMNSVPLFLLSLINFRNIEKQRASQNRQRTKGHGKTC